MLQSYFIIPGAFTKSQQNCNHSLTSLPLNSGFDDAAKLLLHTLEGGGGVILKKNFLQALVGRKKLHAAQM